MPFGHLVLYGNGIKPFIRKMIPNQDQKPKHYRNVLGKTAARDLARRSPLRWDLKA